MYSKAFNDLSILSQFTLIKKYGYPCEIHRAYTEDRYILELHRVPYGRQGKLEGQRPVVFLQHGLLSSSAEWVLMTPDKGLGKYDSFLYLIFYGMRYTWCYSF